MIRSGALGTFQQNCSENSRFPFLGTVSACEKIVISLLTSITSLVLTLLSLLPALFSDGAATFCRHFFSHFVQGCKDVAEGVIGAVPLVGTLFYYSQGEGDKMIRYRNSANEDALIPAAGSCVAIGRVLIGIIQVIIALCGMFLLAIPAFFDRENGSAKEHYGAADYFKKTLNVCSEGIEDIFRGSISFIHLFSTWRSALIEQPGSIFSTAYKKFSLYTPLPILGIIPAVGKVLTALIQAVGSLVAAIFTIIPHLLDHEASSAIFYSALAQLQEGSKQFFCGIIEAIPVVGTVFSAVRKVKEEGTVDIDRIALETEAQFTSWTKYPLIGTFCGIGKVIFGAIQLLFAAAIALLSALPALIFYPLRPLFMNSLRHGCHGIANIAAGTMESLPLVGPLFFAIRSHQTVGVHFSWMHYEITTMPSYPTQSTTVMAST